MRKNALNIVNNNNYLLKRSNYIKNDYGYNLVILSMIILIMGAIMTAVIGYYDTSNITRKTRITEDKFKVIHTALVNYIMKYGKLPCPAPLDCDQNGCNGTETHPEKTLGVEFRRNLQIENECLDDGMGVFKSKNEHGEELLYGNVPAMTLGLDSNYLVDNWNNKMIYIIPELLTRDNALKNINNSSIYAGNSGEYVKDGEMFLLLSNNINTPGAYPLNNRESNVFDDTVIVEVEDEDGTVSKVEQQVSNLPQKDFSVDLNDGHYLKYSRNLRNFFEGIVGSGTGGNELINPDCEAIEVNYNTADGNENTTLEYNYTGHYETFTVPDGVDKIYIELWGGAGGDVGLRHDKYGNPVESLGGEGGYMKGTLNVKPGENYYIFVGQKGANEGEAYDTMAWNGGGKQDYEDGGGGGATDIRLVVNENDPTDWKTTLESRILVVGGGGGASVPNPYTTALYGGEDGANGCGCSNQLEGYALTQFGISGRLCYGDNTIYKQQDYWNTYIAIGGGRSNTKGHCKVLGGNTIMGGGGYYAGGGTCGGISNKGTRIGRRYSCVAVGSYTGGCLFSYGAGAGGAGFYSSAFNVQEATCGGNRGKDGKVRITYQAKTDGISGTFTYNTTKYGETAFSNEECPYLVSNPPAQNDFYSLSNFRDINNVVVTNKMALECGLGGKWKTRVVNGFEEYDYEYRCIVLEKCKNPNLVKPNIEWNVNYDVAYTGVVESVDGKYKMECGIDKNGNAQWYSK